MSHGTVRVRTVSREMFVRMAKIVKAQTKGGHTIMVTGRDNVPTITREQPDIPVPDDLPFKYIVLGSTVNPGSPYRYETDTLLTDADIRRMIQDEDLKVIFDSNADVRQWRRQHR